MVVLRSFLGVLGLAAVSGAFRTSLTLKDFREQMVELESKENHGINTRDVDPATLYPIHTLQVPIDHFHNDSKYEPHSNGTFGLRYWFDPSRYKAGGPIIVLQGGETSGADRLPFLQKGIVAHLSEATNGLGVILEHRYYGKSFPVPDLSTENLRFLTTEQALADMAYFAQHIVFPGLEHLDLTAPKNAYIAYGGSYAGAFVAFLRKLYPNVYWGAISSSGVTEAIYDYWEYYTAARLYAPKECVEATQKLTNVIDNILGKDGQASSALAQRLKAAFGLGNLTRSDDFANSVSWGIAGLQLTNWDPAENSTDFGLYCANISSETILYPEAAAAPGLKAEVQSLITAGGYGDELEILTPQMLNYIGYINRTVVRTCGANQDVCLTNFNSTFYRQDNIKQVWRAWPYQYCTEWGYLQTGSGIPADQLPLISRLIDLNYTTVVCREAFNITTPPNVEIINQYGGFNISYPRLAIIDGEKDPWRAATPHAIGLPERESTTSEPFILIRDGVHHWDENGLFSNETTPELPPRPVAEAQSAEAEFVKAWMVEWRKSRYNDDTLRQINDDL